jgi:hypothetical protein
VAANPPPQLLSITERNVPPACLTSGVYWHRMKLDFIRPEKPTENWLHRVAQRRLRDGCLNVTELNRSNTCARYWIVGATTTIIIGHTARSVT